MLLLIAVNHVWFLFCTNNMEIYPDLYWLISFGSVSVRKCSAGCSLHTPTRMNESFRSEARTRSNLWIKFQNPVRPPVERSQLPKMTFVILCFLKRHVVFILLVQHLHEEGGSIKSFFMIYSKVVKLKYKHRTFWDLMPMTFKRFAAFQNKSHPEILSDGYCAETPDRCLSTFNWVYRHRELTMYVGFWKDAKVSPRMGSDTLKRGETKCCNYWE